MTKNICIIGAGNIGSRHLQGLAKVKQVLSIQVIDPSFDSLALAKNRYEEIADRQSKNQVNYLQDLNQITKPIDIAIIATNSNIRSAITKQLLDKIHVRYIIFEKILFDQFNQYEEIKKILAEKKIKAWVNCPRRMMPFYKNLLGYIKDTKIQYIVSGSQWGLACNAIHFIDHIAYLTSCYDFEADTKHLNPILINSKRKGFLELTGTLTINFKDGSFGSLTCYPTGNTPQILEVLSENYRSLTLETVGKSYISSLNSNWQWHSKTTPLLYQSEMTNLVVDSLLKNDSCDLTPFDLSAKLHLNLLRPLQEFVNAHSKAQYKHYPFT